MKKPRTKNEKIKKSKNKKAKINPSTPQLNKGLFSRSEKPLPPNFEGFAAY